MVEILVAAIVSSLVTAIVFIRVSRREDKPRAVARAVFKVATAMDPVNAAGLYYTRCYLGRWYSWEDWQRLLAEAAKDEWP